MPERTLCQHFMHGGCLKGEHCEFSHDWNSHPKAICTFNQRGTWSYCPRYDHVEASSLNISLPSSSVSTQANPNFQVVSNGSSNTVASVPLKATSLSGISSSSGRAATTQDLCFNYFTDPSAVRPSDRPICDLAVVGKCFRGESCPHIHGDICLSYKDHCRHPYIPEERVEHMRSIQIEKQFEAWRQTKEIKCSLCADKVLSKPILKHRKFGILSECNHPFCLSCITNWRHNSTPPGMNLRLDCPICEKPSNVMAPSFIWYFTNEEKQEIIDNHKAKLRTKHCWYFQFGNGTCRYGTYCFFKHAYRNGRLA